MSSKRKQPKFQSPPPSSGVASALLANAGLGSATVPGGIHLNVGNPLLTARAHLEAGNMAEAEAHYRAILKKDPRNAQALMSMGIVMQKRMRWSDALKYYRKSIRIDAGNAEAHNGLGIVLQFYGKLEEAIASFKLALKLDPEFVGVLNNMGIAYREMGDFEKAAEYFERTIERDPNIAEAWNGLSRTGRLGAQPERIEMLRKVASNPALSQDAKRNAWFALGKFCDDAGLYDEAFESYTKANAQRLVPASWKPECAQMARTSEFFSTDYLAKCPRADIRESDSGPVFILGMPRSGTTLVEQIIASHPQADWGGELHYFGKKTLPNASGKGIKSRDFPENLENLTKYELQKMRKEFFAEFSRDRDSRKRKPLVITDKTPFNFLYIGLISMVLPDARIIHCRRHRLDTALSVYFTDFAKVYPFATDMEAIARYTQGYETMMDDWSDKAPLPILDLDYEYLVENQDVATRELISFCGLPWHDACLSYHKTDRQVSTPSDWQVRQPIYNASISRWRHYEKHLDSLLRIFGEQEA